jgi:hypothetical protein
MSWILMAGAFAVAFGFVKVRRGRISKADGRAY